MSDRDPAELDLHFLQAGIAADAESVQRVESTLETEVNAAAGDLLGSRIAAMRSGGYILRRPSQEFGAEGQPNGAFFVQDDLEDQTALAAGRFPAVWGGGAIEIAIEASQAARFDLALGDELWAQPFWLGARNETRVVVVGLLEPSADERTWSALDGSFLPMAARETELRFWALREDVLGPLAAESPSLRVALLHRYLVDPSALDAAAAETAGARLEQMRTRLAQQLPGLAQDSQLEPVLADFRQRFRFAQGTLLMVVMQLVGAVLVYVVITSAMLSEQRTEDTAWLLRSRGARRRDVAVLHLVEAGVLTAPAVALGPLIGMGLVALLGLVAAVRQRGGGGRSCRCGCRRWPGIWRWGAGLAALAAQAAPAYRATGETIVTTRRARGRPRFSGVSGR